MILVTLLSLSCNQVGKESFSVIISMNLNDNQISSPWISATDFQNVLDLISNVEKIVGI